MTPEAHHYLGIEMNQQVWTLLGKDDRDDRDNCRMEHFALASLYHWERSLRYTPINAQRGHWLLARVYAVLSRPDASLLHAEKCLSLTRELDLNDFDLAYAHEAWPEPMHRPGMWTKLKPNTDWLQKPEEPLQRTRTKRYS